MPAMEKNRLEAFSDGVIAIILTIMVLDLKVPKEHTFAALALAWPVFGAYSLSYWNVFLIWLNHHSIFSTLDSVNPALLKANGLLLFTMSLIPFATAFASESHWTEPVPVVIYGVVMASVSLAFAHLRRMAARSAGTAPLKAHHLVESRISLWMLVIFLLGSTAAWFAPRAGLLLYALIPLARRAHRRFFEALEPKAG
jgi:uncharacterized membrane protein